MDRRTGTPVAWPPEPRPPHPDPGAFEQALASNLPVMKDECLVRSVKGSGRYVQPHVSPTGGVPAEAVSNDHLPAGEVAALVAPGWTMAGPAPDASGPREISSFVRVGTSNPDFESDGPREGQGPHPPAHVLLAPGGGERAHADPPRSRRPRVAGDGAAVHAPQLDGTPGGHRRGGNGEPWGAGLATRPEGQRESLVKW